MTRRILIALAACAVTALAACTQQVVQTNGPGSGPSTAQPQTPGPSTPKPTDDVSSVINQDDWSKRPWLLSPDGYGPALIGQRLDAAEKAKAAHWDPDVCEGRWVLLDKSGGTVAYPLTDDFDKDTPVTAIHVGNSRVLTPEGLHVGSTREELIAAWGADSRRKDKEHVGQTELYVKSNGKANLIAEIDLYSSPDTIGKIVQFTLVRASEGVSPYFGETLGACQR